MLQTTEAQASIFSKPLADGEGDCATNPVDPFRFEELALCRKIPPMDAFAKKVRNDEFWHCAFY
jgi:hypothetical protein